MNPIKYCSMFIIPCLAMAAPFVKPSFNRGDFYRTFEPKNAKHEVENLEKILSNVKIESIFAYCDNKIKEPGGSIELTNICAKIAIETNDSDCHFIENFFNDKRYDAYLKEAIDVQRSSIAIMGRPINVIYSKEEIIYKLDLIYCTIYKWCKEHPKSSKYLLNHPATEDGTHSGLFWWVVETKSIQYSTKHPLYPDSVLK